MLPRITHFDWKSNCSTDLIMNVAPPSHFGQISTPTNHLFWQKFLPLYFCHKFIFLIAHSCLDENWDVQRFLCKNQFNIFLTKVFFQLGIKWLGRYNSGTWRSPECYIGGYYWFLAVGGQERSKHGPEWASFIYIYIYKTFGFAALERPLNRSRIPEKDSNQLGKSFGVHFWCPWAI